MKRSRALLSNIVARPTCYLYDSGVVPYAEAWSWQQALVSRRLASAPLAGSAEDDAVSPMAGSSLQQQQQSQPPRHRNVVLALQHPHVYTLGRAATVNHLLWDEAASTLGHTEGQLLDPHQKKDTAANTTSTSTTSSSTLSSSPSSPLILPTYKGPGNSTVHRVERGGKVTYHGPGQLVVYPLLDLRYFKRDLHWYVTSIEEVLIRTLQDGYQIKATRLPGFPGVWVRGKKIAAVGMACSKWFTSHGLALNVNPDLEYFRRIIPCGVNDREVTSLQEELRFLRKCDGGGGGGGESIANEQPEQQQREGKGWSSNSTSITVDDVKPILFRTFADVFGCELVVAANGETNPLTGEG